MSNEYLIKCHELVKAIRDKKVLLERADNNKLRVTPIDKSTEMAAAIRANLDVVTAIQTGSKADDSCAGIKRIRQAQASCEQVLETGELLPECICCLDWSPWLKDGKPTGLCLSRRASGDTGILNGGGRP
jgi:hypothetical protein